MGDTCESFSETNLSSILLQASIELYRAKGWQSEGCAKDTSVPGWVAVSFTSKSRIVSLRYADTRFLKNNRSHAALFSGCVRSPKGASKFFWSIQAKRSELSWTVASGKLAAIFRLPMLP